MSEKVSPVVVPREQWAEFLRSFNRKHRHWHVQLRTHDNQTGETVLSPQTLLQSIELDLEDEENPRINVIVELDNKVIKHILFRPSQVISHPSSRPGSAEALHIDSVHTATTIHLVRSH